MGKEREIKKRSSSPKTKKAATLPYAFPRPALMQTWGEVSELKELRAALMREYDSSSLVVKILVHELAFYTWEIHELMKVKYEFTRRQYLDALNNLVRGIDGEIDEEVRNAFMRHEASASKMLDGLVSRWPVDAGELIITAMSHHKNQIDTIDVMMTAAERRRSQILKELDRFEMARLIISERKIR